MQKKKKEPTTEVGAAAAAMVRARVAKQTPRRRSEIAANAARARWGKRPAK